MPAITFSLTALTNQTVELGRAAVFVGDYWAGGTTDLSATHVGYTEGNISVALNPEFSNLTLDEATGPAPIKSYIKGTAPVLSFSVVCADATQAALFGTPLGTGNFGTARWREVNYKTLVLFPESLFIKSNAETSVVCTKGSPNTWTIGGDAATVAQTALIAKSLWFWKGYFTPATLQFNPADGGKAMAPVEFHCVHDFTRADGAQLFTLGDPFLETTPIQIDYEA